MELHCTYDPETISGGPSTKKVKGTIHWVNAKECKTAEVRLYDYLFTADNPYDCPEGTDFIDNLNPNSLEVLPDAKIEPIYVRTNSCAMATSASTRTLKTTIWFSTVLFR